MFEETDLDLQHFLGSRGMRKGNLSKFGEDAVRWRVLDQTVHAIHKDNEDLSEAELNTFIDTGSAVARYALRYPACTIAGGLTSKSLLADVLQDAVRRVAHRFAPPGKKPSVYPCA